MGGKQRAAVHLASDHVHLHTHMHAHMWAMFLLMCIRHSLCGPSTALNVFKITWGVA
jgi:hypothetical protein